MKIPFSFSLSAVMVIVLSLVACTPSEGDTIQKISKSWQLNKYYENNIDKTAEFKALNKNFTLQFYTDKTFLQSAVVNDTLRVRSGSYELNEKLDSLFLYTVQDTNRFFIRLLRIKNLNLREAKADSTFDYLMIDF
jgi:hypothetical protein